MLASLLLREKLHEEQRSDLQWTGKEAADASWAPRKVQRGSEPLGRGSGSREKGSGCRAPGKLRAGEEGLE